MYKNTLNFMVFLFCIEKVFSSFIAYKSVIEKIAWIFAHFKGSLTFHFPNKYRIEAVKWEKLKQLANDLL